MTAPSDFAKEVAELATRELKRTGKYSHAAELGFAHVIEMACRRHAERALRLAAPMRLADPLDREDEIRIVLNEIEKGSDR